MHYLWVGFSLIPVPFLFHYYETSRYPGDADFLFIGTLLIAALVAFLSKRVKVSQLALVNIIMIALSVWLGVLFITPPNEAWFNPIGMSYAIVFTGVVIFLVELMLRSVIKAILSKE